MARLIVSRLLIVAIALLIANPILAITNGQPDNGAHPYVAWVKALPPGATHLGPGLTGGALISPNVVLVLGIVARNINVLQSLGFRFFAGFTDPIDASGTPNPLIIEVDQSIPNPGALTVQRSDNTGLGVLILKSAVPGVTPATLPTLHELDSLNVHNGLHDESFDVVGFGIGDRDFSGTGMPFFPFSLIGPRLATVADFLALGPVPLVLSRNPVLGDGGPCFGDAGAPALLRGTNEVVGVAGFGGDDVCRAMSKFARVDTDDGRAFLGQFVSLP
ncbi:MAG: hypothetical protein HY049_10955 [Acidobacteria bacterium]|nr:hypothetical protein [Acidobacteriota bacterium]